MKIRELEPTDHGDWLSMRSTLWPHCTQQRHASEMRAYSSRGGPFATFVAVDANGQLCGFLEASLRSTAEGCTSRPVGYIEGIFVQSASRRCGIRRLLVVAAQRWAMSRDCIEFASDCHAHNEVSIQFHRRLGFDIAKQLIHFRRALSNEPGQS